MTLARAYRAASEVLALGGRWFVVGECRESVS
jgi:hypothetical protein